MLQQGPLTSNLFPNLARAIFLTRPNRFVIECLLDNKYIRAYLPNPGRLWELLIPGRTVYLSKRMNDPSKMPYTAVAVEREGKPVMLHTHHANTVMQALIESKRISGLEDMELVRREAKAGSSRFDFLLRQKDGKDYYLEVKSCTLFGKTLALFPDAVTERGERHVRELVEMPSKGGVFFVVNWPYARYFSPDFHTDLDFSRTLLKARGRITIRAVSVEWTEDLTLTEDVGELAIPWDLIEEEAEDRGSYLLLLNVPERTDLSIGKLGLISFPAGWYIYVGSAKRYLTKRVQRHLRKRKNKFWHIDYLRDHAKRCIALPIRSSDDLEHEIARTMDGICEWNVQGFGSSDCACDSHLFAMRKNPLQDQHFIDALLYLRIGRLEKKIEG